MKTIFSVSLNVETAEKIEQTRGAQSRSAFLAKIVESALEQDPQNVIAKNLEAHR